MQTPGNTGPWVYPVSEPGYGVPIVQWVPDGGTPVQPVSELGYGAQPVYVIGGPPVPMPPPWYFTGSAPVQQDFTGYASVQPPVHSGPLPVKASGAPDRSGFKAAALLLLF